MKPNFRIRVISFILTLLFFTGCQITFIEQPQPTLPVAPSTPTIPLDPPVIQSFEIQPAEILIGESSVLEWKVKNAKTIEISPGIGTVMPEGSLSLMPEERTTYQIAARNAGGSANCNTVVNVNRNTKAKPIALTIEEMEDLGFRFVSNSEPSTSGAISTYYIKFSVELAGPTYIDNTVYVYRTISESETIFAEEKNNTRMYINSFMTIGTQGYYMIVQSAEPPLLPMISIRFQKNNVYVKMNANLEFPQVEAYARLVEERIK